MGSIRISYILLVTNLPSPPFRCVCAEISVGNDDENWLENFYLLLDGQYSGQRILRWKKNEKKKKMLIEFSKRTSWRWGTTTPFNLFPLDLLKKKKKKNKKRGFICIFKEGRQIKTRKRFFDSSTEEVVNESLYSLPGIACLPNFLGPPDTRRNEIGNLCFLISL